MSKQQQQQQQQTSWERHVAALTTSVVTGGVKRFAGKVMAITGYEQDQVMVDPVGSPGANPEKDVSVPINWAYNHHYMAWMTGAHSEMQYIANPDPNDVSAHGAPAKWIAIDLPSAKDRADPTIPTNQMFSEGNGGESRKSFHGYPDGFAQLIESPTEWHITPMQIDTRRRDCGATAASVNNCTRFEPAFEARQARYGRGAPKGTNYSGILECPCNSRFGGDPIFYPDAKTKLVAEAYAALNSGSCSKGHALLSIPECYAAAIEMGLAPAALTNATIADATKPAGCSFVAKPDGGAVVTLNSAGTAACAPGNLRSGGTTTHLWKQSVPISFNLTLDSAPAGGLATLTLRGPSTAWFGVGLGANVMADAPYTFVVNSTGVFERKIGTCGSEAEHCPGDALASSLTIVSNTVADGVRSVVATRPFKGLTPKHHTFDPKLDATLKFIAAVGTGQVFGYHAAHASSSLVLLAPAGTPTCVCSLGDSGQLCETGGKNCKKFTKGCTAAWDGVPTHAGGDLLTQQNPTCNARQYSGGLTCCGHRRILLDADQDPGDELLRYHMKFRFWFQEYKPAVAKVKPSHYDLPRYYQQTEGNAGEYDIPPAFRRPNDPLIPGYPHWPASTSSKDFHPTPGTTCTGDCPDGPDCDCIHTITYHWSWSNVSLVYAGGHCHAPSCISIELYKNVSGKLELLCNQSSLYGTGAVHQDKYDEAGYLALPPCLWGSKEEGLQSPVYLESGTQLYSIKKNRNTHSGHYGEMASWQTRGVPFDTAKGPQMA